MCLPIERDSSECLRILHSAIGLGPMTLLPLLVYCLLPVPLIYAISLPKTGGPVRKIDKDLSNPSAQHILIDDGHFETSGLEFSSNVVFVEDDPNFIDIIDCQAINTTVSSIKVKIKTCGNSNYTTGHILYATSRKTCNAGQLKKLIIDTIDQTETSEYCEIHMTTKEANIFEIYSAGTIGLTSISKPKVETGSRHRELASYEKHDDCKYVCGEYGLEGDECYGGTCEEADWNNDCADGFHPVDTWGYNDCCDTIHNCTIGTNSTTIDGENGYYTPPECNFKCGDYDLPDNQCYGGFCEEADWSNDCPANFFVIDTWGYNDCCDSVYNCTTEAPEKSVDNYFSEYIPHAECEFKCGLYGAPGDDQCFGGNCRWRGSGCDGDRLHVKRDTWEPDYCCDSLYTCTHNEVYDHWNKTWNIQPDGETLMESDI